MMKHVSHFVHSGAYRLKTSGGKDHLAFMNPDGTVVLVLVNTAETDKKFTIAASGKTFEITVKAKSFNSLTWK
jgi:glucosylceramidase